MRAVIQRVSSARVLVEGATVGEIGGGLVVLVGFGNEDDGSALEWVADKIWGLRIFSDEEGRMNRSAADDGLALLVISQFTLYGDVSRGRRPSFGQAARPGPARELYTRFIEICRRGGHVETGEFGAMMKVELVNEGPVTIQLER
jgi:D-tyrosyl-tRNA(Tyr) deacylase